MKNLVYLNLASLIGQILVYYLINTMSSLTVSIYVESRKFALVFVYSLIGKNALTFSQLIYVSMGILVFIIEILEKQDTTLKTVKNSQKSLSSKELPEIENKDENNTNTTEEINLPYYLTKNYNDTSSVKLSNLKRDINLNSSQSEISLDESSENSSDHDHENNKKIIKKVINNDVYKDIKIIKKEENLKKLNTTKKHQEVKKSSKSVIITNLKVKRKITEDSLRRNINNVFEKLLDKTTKNYEYEKECSMLQKDKKYYKNLNNISFKETNNDNFEKETKNDKSESTNFSSNYSGNDKSLNHRNNTNNNKLHTSELNKLSSNFRENYQENIVKKRYNNTEGIKLIDICNLNKDVIQYDKQKKISNKNRNYIYHLIKSIYIAFTYNSNRFNDNSENEAYYDNLIQKENNFIFKEFNKSNKEIKVE